MDANKPSKIKNLESAVHGYLKMTRSRELKSFDKRISLICIINKRSYFTFCIFIRVGQWCFVFRPHSPGFLYLIVLAVWIVASKWVLLKPIGKSTCQEPLSVAINDSIPLEARNFRLERFPQFSSH